MRRLLLLLAVLTCSALPATAQPIRVEAIGFGTVTSASDRDAARRRAVADALLAAALVAGADVAGHTSTSRGIVTSDVAMVRTVGRVLDHRILDETLSGQVWRVRISALVGEGTGPLCPIRTLLVTAYAPQIHVDPHGPPWSGELAGLIAQRMVEGLARHPAVQLSRVTDRAMPRTSRNGEGFDYEVLTRGSVRLAGGGHGFTPVIRLRMAGPSVLELDLELHLTAGDGTTGVQRHVRRVRLPGASPLGGLAVLVQPGREALAAALTEGADRALAALLDAKGCEPVTARLTSAGEVQVGRANGLTPGSLAFTADGGSTQMLEIVHLTARSARLRPLDPTVPATALAGRPVRFIETGR